MIVLAILRIVVGIIVLTYWRLTVGIIVLTHWKFAALVIWMVSVYSLTDVVIGV